RIDLNCPSNATVLDVVVDLSSRAGSAEFTLRDPDGKVVWRILAQGGHAAQQGEMPAIAGVWKGELVLDAFSGDYELRLFAHDGPALDFDVTVTGAAPVEGGDGDSGDDEHPRGSR